MKVGCIQPRDLHSRYVEVAALMERQAFRVFCEAVTINLLRGFP